MLTKKNLRGFYMLEMALVFFIELVLVIFTVPIVNLSNSTSGQMLIMIGVYVGLTGVSLITFYSGKSKDVALGFSKENIGKQLGTGIIIAGIAIFLAVVLPLLLGVPKARMGVSRIVSTEILVFYLFYNFFCIGFGEEIIFRGYFYIRTKDITNKPWAPMMVSAILFGVWHYTNTQSVWYGAITCGLGLFYGGCRWKIESCTLLSLGIAHGLQNISTLLLSYYMF